MVSTSHRFPATHDLDPTQLSRHATSKRTSNPASVIERLMHDSASGQDVTSQLTELKRHILLDGIDADETGMSPHRVYIWLILLHCPITPYSHYAALLARGASPSYAKINNDTFRTLATDPLFARRVSQNSISRLLNTIAWTLHDAALERHRADHSIATTTELPPSPPPEGVAASETASESDFASSMLAEPPSPRIVASDVPSTGTGTSNNNNNNNSNKHPNPTATPGAGALLPSTHHPAPTYLQGMNVLAAPLLYTARSEPQAYALLRTLLTVQLPSYTTPSMTGVHRALALLTRLLALLDPPLAAHLAAKRVHAETYAFASVLTLSACTPPLPEVLVLWDFYLAWGVHLNVLGVVAQLVLFRERLLASDGPGRELRGLPQLRARRVVELVVSFVGKVPEGLWAELVAHTRVD